MGARTRVRPRLVVPDQRLSVQGAFALALLLLSAEALFPLDPGVAPRNYLHTSWTRDEGIELPAVIALAQTSDGYLWLGTSDGLIRFDGMHFVRWEPISGEKLSDNHIRYLRASAEGGL